VAVDAVVELCQLQHQLQETVARAAACRCDKKHITCALAHKATHTSTREQPWQSGQQSLCWRESSKSPKRCCNLYGQVSRAEVKTAGAFPTQLHDSTQLSAHHLALPPVHPFTLPSTPSPLCHHRTPVTAASTSHSVHTASSTPCHQRAPCPLPPAHALPSATSAHALPPAISALPSAHALPPAIRTRPAPCHQRTPCTLPSATSTHALPPAISAYSALPSAHTLPPAVSAAPCPLPSALSLE
jgi:hypothetical protein